MKKIIYIILLVVPASLSASNSKTASPKAKITSSKQTGEKSSQKTQMNNAEIWIWDNPFKDERGTIMTFPVPHEYRKIDEVVSESIENGVLIKKAEKKTYLFTQGLKDFYDTEKLKDDQEKELFERFDKAMSQVKLSEHYHEIEKYHHVNFRITGNVVRLMSANLTRKISSNPFVWIKKFVSLLY